MFIVLQNIFSKPYLGSIFVNYNIYYWLPVFVLENISVSGSIYCPSTSVWIGVAKGIINNCNPVAEKKIIRFWTKMTSVIIIKCHFTIGRINIQVIALH